MDISSHDARAVSDSLPLRPHVSVSRIFNHIDTNIFNFGYSKSASLPICLERTSAIPKSSVRCLIRKIGLRAETGANFGFISE